ncbi:MAG TPA: type I-C CRISPR-associated protein Cas7/Csd2 [Tepidisphaeraceae bacterium]|nr:type I-C CRISPR-associated protein Cas7/Csd2 [Tepidisphaeraceae bacterium]
MNTPVTKRYDFVLLFDVINGNPNGDPDAGNSPRIDPETGHGLVSDVCIKRKIRNYITLAKPAPAADTSATPKKGYHIYVKERAILNLQHQRAYDALGLDPDAKPEKAEKKEKGEKAKKPNGPVPPTPEEQARKWMCQTFFDVRMFGAVMSTGVNAGQVRGPVQIAFSRSIDPIISLEQSITRMAVTTEEESKNQEGGNRTMGRKEIVPYGLYRCHGFVNAHLAAQTGFDQEDLDLLWQALANMFEHDRSAARGEMTSRRLFVFEHDSALGGAPAHRLFDRVRFERTDKTKPARAFSDYQQLDAAALKDLPAGVRLDEKL